MYQIFFLLILIHFVDSISYCTSDLNIPKNIIENDGATLIYFLKNSWQFYDQQINMLTRMQNSFLNIGVKFKLVLAIDEYSSKFKRFKKLRTGGNTIDYGNLWKYLEPQGDDPQAFVFDRCGKLAYEVIYPWSLLDFPFVKAAVLSTFHDKPCGSCENFDHHLDENENGYEKYTLPVYPKLKKSNLQNQKNKKLSIDIVIKERHKHEGSEKVYEYLEWQLGNPEYHQHFRETNNNDFQIDFIKGGILERPNVIKIEEDSSGEEYNHFEHQVYTPKLSSTVIKDFATDPKETMETESEELPETDEIRDNQPEFLDIEGLDYADLADIFSFIGADTSDAEDSKEKREKEETMHHYRKILNWISYIV